MARGPPWGQHEKTGGTALRMHKWCQLRLWIHSVHSWRSMPMVSSLGDIGIRPHFSVMTHYLLLYARIKDTVYLLSIRHQRQLSFDFEALWNRH